MPLAIGRYGGATMASGVHAIRVHEVGGAEALRWEETELDAPGAGEVRLRHRCIGLNFIDIYHREGYYPLPLPLIPGVEAAGEIEALGPGVTDFAVGERAAYAGVPGAYAEARNIRADKLIRIPA